MLYLSAWARRGTEFNRLPAGRRASSLAALWIRLIVNFYVYYTAIYSNILIQNATPKPRVVTMPASWPLSSKASGIMVSAAW